MMKRLLGLIFLQALCLSAAAQVPGTINYQAVARDKSGLPLVSQPIGLQFQLRRSGSVVYSENISASTSSLGLFSVQIGKNGGLDTLAWTNSMTLEVGIDVNGGSNYVSIGEQPLASVPFAFSAQSVPSSFNAANNVLTVGNRTMQLSAGTNYTAGTNVSITSGSVISATPTLSIPAPNTMSISGGNTVALPSYSLNQGAGTIDLVQDGTVIASASVGAPTIVATGIATVSTAGLAFTVSVDPPALSLSGNTITLTQGTATSNVVIPPPTLALGGVNNSSLSAGGNTVTLNTYTTGTGLVMSGTGPDYTLSALPQTNSVVGAGAAVVTPSTGNSFTVNVPPSNIAMTFTGNAANVSTVSLNNFNLNLPPPSYTAASGVLSTASGSTVINPSLALAGNVLSVGSATNSIALPLTQTITSSGVAVVSPTTGNVFNVNVPATSVSVSTSAAATGFSTVTPNNFNLNLQAPSFAPSTGVLTTASGTVQTTPAAALVGNVLTIGPSTNAVTLPLTQTITGSGAAVLTPTSGNSFNVNVAPTNVALTTTVGAAAFGTTAINNFNLNLPPPSFNGATGVLSTASGAANVTPTLQITGNVLTVGPSTNNIALPVNHTVTGQGAAVVTPSAGNVFTVNVPATNIVLTNTTGAAAFGTTAVNNLNLNLPPPSYNGATGQLGTASGAVNINPPLALAGNVLSVGSSTNSIALPLTQSITGAGIATVSPASGNSFTVAVTTPTITAPSGISTVSGSYPSWSINTPSPVIVGTGATTVNATYPNYSIDTPTPNIVGTNATTVSGIFPNYTVDTPTPSIVGSGATTVSGIFPNYVVTTPVPSASVAGTGLATVSPASGLSFTVDVPIPSFTQSTGVLANGTNTLNISPALSLTDSVLKVGSPTNTVGLPWARTTSLITTANNSAFVGIGTSSPVRKLQIEPQSNSIQFGEGQVSMFHNSGAGNSLFAQSNGNGAITGSTSTIYAEARLAGYNNTTPFSGNYDVGVWGVGSGVTPSWGVIAQNGLPGSAATYAALGGNVYSGIFMGGNIGIGTISPSATLEVNGTIKFVDGSQGNGKVLTSDASGNANWQNAPGSLVCYLKDVKGNGSNGGTFTSGSWQTRTLNTVEGNSSIVSLGGNQFTLQSGTYIISAEAPAYGVSAHQLKLFNVSDNVDVIIGQSMYADIVGNVQNNSTLRGTFTISSSKTFAVQHRCTTTKLTSGFGQACSFGVSEVYTQVQITKIN